MTDTDVVSVIELISNYLKGKRAFYHVTKWCPPYDLETGEAFLACVPVDDDSVFVFHPEHFDRFMKMVQITGFVPIEYDFNGAGKCPQF